MSTNVRDNKTPLERGVRDLFKPPLEREYRELIASQSPTASSNTSSTPPPVNASTSDASMGSSTVPYLGASSTHSTEVESVPPPPYRDDGSVAFPEKTSGSQQEHSEGEVLRTAMPCNTIGHDLTLTTCQRRARIATFILCPEVTAWLMCRKRICRRCGEKVKPKNTIFHH